MQPVGARLLTNAQLTHKREHEPNMKKPNITPGEWTACNTGKTMSEGHNQPRGVISLARGHELVCGAFADHRGGILECDANATAIAAIPKLLEALEMVLPDWHKEDDGTAHDLGIVAELTVGNVRAIKSALLAAGYTE